MSFGSILGQIMQQGLGGQGQTRDRLQTTADNLDQAGGGVGSIFSQIEGALGRAGIGTAGAGQAAGGFADRTRDFMRSEQVGSLTGAQIGGIGALAGALLGGGLGGAARGGAMAVLGTLALGALKRAQAERAGSTELSPPEEEEIRALTGPDSERLALRAMISAAKADGQIDQGEMQKIIGKIGDVSPEERQFVLDQMAAPLDVAALAAEARTPAQAAEVYAASLLAIDVDSDRERAYLGELARALGLDAATVAQLHRMTGAPQAA
jgi:uncharacterized membrane protein YebE (DUF533 family)